MQADLRGILTREIEVRTSGDYFHELACKPDQLAQISPSEVQGCNVQEGVIAKNGSVIVWNYTHEGKACVAKEIIENLDVEKKRLTYRVIEGDILSMYKTFLIHLQVTPGDDNISVVKLSLEYEKVKEEVGDPTSIADFLVNLSQKADDHLNTSDNPSMI